MIKILGDDNHIKLTIWHLNQFTHRHRDMSVYIYIFAKIPVKNSHQV